MAGLYPQNQQQAYLPGFAYVIPSSSDSISIASSRHSPQIKVSALKPPQTAGRPGELKIPQRKSSVKWIHFTPAGFPSGIPGIDDEMEGIIQQAPQPSLHFIF